MEKAEGYRERGKPITQPVMEVVSEPLRNVFSDQRFGKAVHEEIKLPGSTEDRGGGAGRH